MDFMSDKSPNQATAAQRFWDAFRACLEGNRVRQAEHSVKILYEEFLPGYAPDGRTTSSLEIGRRRRGMGSRTKDSPFRNRVIPGEVDRLFSPLLHALKTEVRGRSLCCW